MGICTPRDISPHKNQSLLAKVETLQEECSALETPYRNSVVRREKIFQNGGTQRSLSQVLRDISMKQFLSNPSEMVSKHLGLIETSFAYAASCRRSVSNALTSVIEKAQKTLLDSVGREFDASEAYAGFHDALFRLPALSKDLILSCITEMEALIDGIDSMTQSEIEALTVVWEALKVPPSDRRNFWGSMEKYDSNESTHQNTLLDQETTSMNFCEMWYRMDRKSCEQSYRGVY